MAAPDQAPSVPEAPSLESKSMGDVFKETIAQLDQKPELSRDEEKLYKKVVNLEAGYETKQLKIHLDTHQEIDGLRTEIMARLGDLDLSDTDATELKAVVAEAERREAVEDHLNAVESSAKGPEAATEGATERVETVADLRELSVERLIELEDRHEGVLLYAFTDFLGDNASVDLQHFEAFYREPAIGTRLRVNFRGNAAAEASLGAADVLPPSVRRITVYYGANPDNERTSERRIGLKGQNKSGNGFFDGDGYIPVYSGDEVVVGGAKPDEQTDDDYKKSGGVDIAFDRKYRKPAAKEGSLGELDYEAYEKDFGASDADYLDKLPPTARTSKYHRGASFSDAHRKALGLDANLGRHSKNIEQILKKTPDLYTYAHKAREKYATKTGIDIDESIMFGVIQLESGFRVDVLNGEGSGAGGLFQFIRSTWNSYLAANPWVYERMAKDPTWSRVDQMDWRFNPEIMVDAGYWLATQNMKHIHDRKEQISLREFKSSEFYKTGKVGADDAWLLYLPHHDGAGGAMKLLKYASLREQGVDARAAEARVGLEPFQKYKHRFEGGRTIYDRSTFIADQHWKQLRGYAQQNVTLAKKYRGQLDAMGPARLAALENGPGTWGWASVPEGEAVSQQTPAGYQTEAELDRLAHEPRLSGRSLLIGSSSTVGYGPRVKGDVFRQASEGRTIDQMLVELKKMPVEALRGFDRVVVQGGMKNQPSYEKSVKAMTEMVRYLREKAPDVKIYVLEVTPWDQKHRPDIEKFNRFLNEGKVDGSLAIDGVVPLYGVMNDGAGQLNPLFGKAGELHVSRYDRFAGVVADWITDAENPAA